MGLAFCYCPKFIKEGLARVLISSTKLPNKLANLFYDFSYEFAQSAFWGEPTFFLKIFPDGFLMNLDISQKTQRQILLLRDYEEQITRFLRKSLKRGDVFFDVGAHAGYYTLLASKLVGQDGAIFSFEPEANNFGKLESNVILNNVRNAKLFNIALSDFSGKGTLHINPLNEGGHSLQSFSPGKGIPGGFSEEVRITSLDDFIKKESIKQKIDLIKIDVEGAEFSALCGMESAVESNPNLQIICELSSKNRGETINFLQDRGFKVFIFGPRGLAEFSGLKNIPKANFLFRK